MKQVVQNFKTGVLSVDEVPAPQLSENMILVENKFSLISSGTEKSTVKVGKANLLNKARQRPDLVTQVLKNIKKEGLKATFDKVKNKLDTPKALGYSTSGVILASIDNDGEFNVGDRVACAGQDFASHAEIVSVPKNLVAKIPENVSFEEASFTTLGAIALQGVRQANPRLGDNIAVIGLGLIGQITCQILRANGCNVIGIDIDDYNVELASKESADLALNRNNPEINNAILNFSRGKGLDSVIITAATDSNDPVDFSCEILRRKGSIIIVGAVPMSIQREPHFYKKELELKISCSYGPGRYDANYEEHGIDYPIDYVRYTEQRNMEAFLDLISRNRINIKPFISQVFSIDDAVEAYEMVLGKTEERFTGLLLKYPENEEKYKSTISHRKSNSTELNIGFIGAGSFAQNYLLPNIPKEANLESVATSTGINAKSVAEKFNFSNFSTSGDDIINNEQINTVFIATRHNSHAKYVQKALENGKNVFVEKPLCLTIDELKEIKKAYKASSSILTVGYNRRFSPSAKKIRSILSETDSPALINIRVNAGKLPADHWAIDKNIGGGRIIGEVCHFVDLIQFLSNSQPTKIQASRISHPDNGTINDDNISVTIELSNGSIGNIIYTSMGGSSMAKERIEVFSNEKSFVINDFKTLSLDFESSTLLKLSGKGHKEEVEEFLFSIKNGEHVLTFDSIYNTTLATFKIHDALMTGLPQNVVE